MKKIFAVILAIVMTLSLCACAGQPSNGSGAAEEKSVEKFITVYKGDFTVVKTDWSTHQLYSSGTSYADKYVAVLEYNNTRIMVRINEEQYVCWDDGDIVSGTLKRGSEEYYVTIPVFLNINGEDFNVTWQGE